MDRRYMAFDNAYPLVSGKWPWLRRRLEAAALAAFTYVRGLRKCTLHDDIAKKVRILAEYVL